MGIFDRLDRMAGRTLDRTMAERFTLTPMKTRPNGRSEVDFDREEITARGVYSTVPGPAGVQTAARRPSAQNNDLRALVRGNAVTLSCDRFQFDDMPRQGDMVSWSSRPERGQMMVSSVRPYGKSRVALMLIA